MESKLRVGIAGPVGSGKTAIIQRLCENLKDRLEIAVVTNDIYTQEDAKFLTNSKALALNVSKELKLEVAHIQR